MADWATMRLTWEPRMLSILRIMTGLLFLQHGLQKTIHFPNAGHSTGPFEPFSLMGIAGVIETLGGVLIALGLFTRPTAFVLAGQMAVAYFLFHFRNGLAMDKGFFPVVNQGDLAILFCFVFLHLFFAGPGAFALDNRRAGLGANQSGVLNA
jgi:putative oxidoreductase